MVRAVPRSKVLGSNPNVCKVSLSRMTCHMPKSLLCKVEYVVSEGRAVLCDESFLLAHGYYCLRHCIFTCIGSLKISYIIMKLESRVSGRTVIMWWLTVYEYCCVCVCVCVCVSSVFSLPASHLVWRRVGGWLACPSNNSYGVMKIALHCCILYDHLLLLYLKVYSTYIPHSSQTHCYSV